VWSLWRLALHVIPPSPFPLSLSLDFSLQSKRCKYRPWASPSPFTLPFAQCRCQSIQTRRANLKVEAPKFFIDFSPEKACRA